MRVVELDSSRPEAVLFLEDGEELGVVLKDALLDRGFGAALVAGRGRARRLELDGPGGGPLVLDGPVELLELGGIARLHAGRLLLDLRAVVCPAGAAGSSVTGGVVVRAWLDSGVLRLTPLRGPVEAPEHVAVTPPTVAAGWAAVAAASDSAPRPTPSAEERPPRAGDLVDHPTFGRCKVVRMDDDHLKVRRENGRTISLGLSRIGLTHNGVMGDGKHVYGIRVTSRDER